VLSFAHQEGRAKGGRTWWCSSPTKGKTWALGSDGRPVLAAQEGEGARESAHVGGNGGREGTLAAQSSPTLSTVEREKARTLRLYFISGATDVTTATP